jgi:hypothetical protein
MGVQSAVYMCITYLFLNMNFSLQTLRVICRYDGQSIGVNYDITDLQTTRRVDRPAQTPHCKHPLVNRLHSFKIATRGVLLSKRNMLSDNSEMSNAKGNHYAIANTYPV